MTMFVTGATGYTGREVVAGARRRGIGCWAHVRPDSQGGEGWRERFVALGAEVDRTAWDRGQFAETLARLRPELVFVLVGTTQARAKAARRRGVAADYEDVDYRLPVLLFDACADARIRPRVVYLSSLGASPSGNEYLVVRHRVEAALRASGLPFTIVRPSFITGSDRGELRPAERLGAMATDGGLRVASALGAKRLRARYRSITGPALAENLVRLALDPGAQNRVVEAEELDRS